MKLEPGKTYRTRDGTEVTVERSDDKQKVYTYTGHYGGDRVFWTENGRWHPTHSTGLDIVALKAGQPDHCWRSLGKLQASSVSAKNLY